MKKWIVIDTYKNWTLEKHVSNGKYRVKWDNKIWRQFVATDGSNKRNAEHYFYVTVCSNF